MTHNYCLAIHLYRTHNLKTLGPLSIKKKHQVLKDILGTEYRRNALPKPSLLVEKREGRKRYVLINTTVLYIKTPLSKVL